jgi:serine/threonine protein kinase
MNPDAKKPNPDKHPLAASAVNAAPLKVKAKVKAAVKAKVKAAVKEQEPAPSAVTILVPDASPLPPVPVAKVAADNYLNYLTTKSRAATKQQFESIIRNKDVKQCLAGELDKYFTLKKRIGSGTYGVVHSAAAGDHLFAVKEAASSQNILTYPWSDKTNWSEALILRDISAPIVEKGICPNVPLMYGVYACPTCEFEGLNMQKKKTDIKPCLIMLMELASGDLAHWLNLKPTEPEIYNALFQVLAGLYALQKHGQVVNDDIKSPNILYYDVKPGGYWVYNIMGKRYHVPNLGKLFVINDFGVSRAYAPEFQYSYSKERNGYSLGQRAFTVLERKLVPFSTLLKTQMVWHGPIPTSSTKKVLPDIKVKLSPQQSDFLVRNGIPPDASDMLFYSNIDIIPVQDFAYDVIDALGMFIGGVPRATQPGMHEDHGVPATVKSVLRKYFPKGTVPAVSLFNRHPTLLNPVVVNAGYMIDELYGKVLRTYLDVPAVGAPIEIFTI